MQHAFEVMKCLLRSNIKDRSEYAETLRTSVPMFDDALVEQYSRLRKCGMAWNTWLEGHRGLAVLSTDDIGAGLDVPAVVAHPTVAPQIARTHASSRLERSVGADAPVIAYHGGPDTDSGGQGVRGWFHARGHPEDSCRFRR